MYSLASSSEPPGRDVTADAGVDFLAGWRCQTEEEVADVLHVHNLCIPPRKRPQLRKSFYLHAHFTVNANLDTTVQLEMDRLICI